MSLLATYKLVIPLDVVVTRNVISMILISPPVAVQTVWLPVSVLKFNVFLKNKGGSTTAQTGTPPELQLVMADPAAQAPVLAAKVVTFDPEVVTAPDSSAALSTPEATRTTPVPDGAGPVVPVNPVKPVVPVVPVAPVTPVLPVVPVVPVVPVNPVVP